MTESDQAQKFLLVRRGLYYKPDRQGYTGVKDHAGRYRQVDALGLDGVLAVHEDDAPAFSEACWPDSQAKHLLTKLSEANERATELHGQLMRMVGRWEEQGAEIERLREALRKIVQIGRGGKPGHGYSCATIAVEALFPGGRK